MEFTSWDTDMRFADPNSLRHFGVQGMKWGQRRYQNEDGSLTSLGKERYGHNGQRSARGVKRDLNMLDREHAQARASRDEWASYAERTKKREEKRAAKRGEKVVYSDKVKSAEAKARQYEKLVRKNEQLTNRIISNSLKKGYSIKSKNVLRSVNTGRNIASSILGTAAGIGLGMLTGTFVTTTSYQGVKGTKYKVKNDGLGKRSHKPTLKKWRGR